MHSRTLFPYHAGYEYPEHAALVLARIKANEQHASEQSQRAAHPGSEPFYPRPKGKAPVEMDWVENAAAEGVRFEGGHTVVNDEDGGGMAQLAIA